MFCPHCGTPNEEYARFCIKCGMEFPHASQAAYAPNQTPKHVRNSTASQQPDVQAEPPLYQAFASDPRTRFHTKAKAKIHGLDYQCYDFDCIAAHLYRFLPALAQRQF